MSAWIVSKAHIDFIVAAAKHFELRVYPDGKELIRANKDPDKIGQILWDENYRSVNYRYEEEKEAPEYHYDVRFDRMTPGIIVKISGGAPDFSTPEGLGFLLKALDCYDYQSCETDDYYNTTACHIVTQLRSEAADELCRITKAAHRAKEAFPWGLDDFDGIAKAMKNAEDGLDCYGYPIRED